METTRTSQTKLPAGERKDNSPSWRLLARLNSDIGPLRQRDRFHGESSICLSKHFTALRSRKPDSAVHRRFIHRRIRSRGRRLSRATKLKRASLNHGGSCGGFVPPRPQQAPDRPALFHLIDRAELPFSSALSYTFLYCLRKLRYNF